MTLDLNIYRRKVARVNLLARGTVLRVTGMTVESYGPGVGVGQMCEICLADGRRVPAEVVGFHNENRILLPLEGIGGVAPGDPVAARVAPRTISLDESMLGRVINALGRPIDGKGPLRGRDRRSLDNTSPPPMSRQKIDQPLAFGVRAIDGLLTCGRGQRMGIFAGSGVGKSTLLGEIARVSEADVNVLALVGERGREVRQFLEESLGDEGLARSVVAVAQSDVSPIQRVKVAFTAIAVAEYFRDQGKNVLFMMDSITRFAQAQREIGLAAGEPPASKGYCPSVFSLLPKLTERLGYNHQGSITGILTILVEGDDMDDPVADSVRSLLDGHIVLSRRLAEMGHYPAIDILQSVSRLMTSVASQAHLQAAQKFRAIYSTYKRAEDLINIGALAPGSNQQIDKAVALIDRVNQFLIQPIGQSCDFRTTVARLEEITRTWNPQAKDAPIAGGGRAIPQPSAVASQPKREVAGSKRFSWPLQRLLELTLQKEDALRAELIKLARDLAALRLEVRRKRADIRQRLAEFAQRSLRQRMAEQEMFARWTGAQEKEIAALNERAGAVETQRKDTMRKYAKVHSSRQALERLRDESLRRYRKERSQWEQKHLDEAAGISHTRKTPRSMGVSPMSLAVSSSVAQPPSAVSSPFPSSFEQQENSKTQQRSNEETTKTQPRAAVPRQRQQQRQQQDMGKMPMLHTGKMPMPHVHEVML